MGMAGVVVDGMGDTGAVVVVGVVVASIVSKLLSIWNKKISIKKKKKKTRKKKCQPHMGMASVVIDSVGDVATVVVVVEVFMPCVVSI